MPGQLHPSTVGSKMILVAGATGSLGSEIVRRLAARGEQVRGLVRSTSAPEKVARLHDLGVETVAGNLRDRASLDAACKGIRAVISTVSIIGTAQQGDSFTDTDSAGTIALIDAAENAGVKHFVFISFDSRGFPDTPIAAAKKDVENRLGSTRMTCTILQPGPFMESWLGPMLFGDPSTGHLKVYGSGNGRIAYVSMKDVAEVAVRAVTTKEAKSSTIAFGGPHALTQRDVVRVFEKTVARPIAIDEVPEQALESQWSSAEDPFQKTFTGLMLGLARVDQETTPLPKELAFDMTTVEDFARSRV